MTHDELLVGYHEVFEQRCFRTSAQKPHSDPNDADVSAQFPQCCAAGESVIPGARSLEVTEARRGPPQQLSSWQSAYSKRLDALGFFDSSEVGSYAYPTDLVRKNIEASSDEDDANWDPEQEGDGCDEVDDDEADESGQADDDIAETVAPFIPQDLER